MRKAVNIICGILAEVCALAVILLGAYLAYDAKASGLDQSYVSHRQEQVSHRKIHKAAPGKTATMRHTDPPAEVEPGDGELFAYLRVPSWGKQFRLPIWQGAAKTVLDKMGGGHYDTTAMPGQVGNSSYAGHNTYADMADIRLLKPGDVVYIETGSYWYRYRYRINSNPEIVDQSRTDVIDQDAAGVERGLTLQTCWPIMTGGNVTHRLIVHGGLDGWAPKSDGVPAEYAESTDTTIDKISRRIVTVSEKTDLPVTRRHAFPHLMTADKNRKKTRISQYCDIMGLSARQQASRSPTTKGKKPCIGSKTGTDAANHARTCHK